MRRAIWIGLAALGVSAPLGWVATDALEARNSFCNACHLDARTPLHAAKRRDFETLPAVNLAGAHFAHDHDFRCADCHGGASLANRLRVKLLSARDTVWYFLGRFEEPKEMDHPLWREDCAKCHATYQPEREDAFHAIEVHNLPNFALNCVQCHEAHPTGRTPELAYLSRERVTEACRNCHEEF